MAHNSHKVYLHLTLTHLRGARHNLMQSFFFFLTIFCVFLTGNPSLEAAFHLVSCRGS